MLSGLAEAIKISPKRRISEAAQRTIDFIFTKLFRDGFLLHTYKDGQAKLFGYLDDYAFLAVGLLDLYEVLFDRSCSIERLSSPKLCCGSFGTRTAAVFFTREIS